MKNIFKKIVLVSLIVLPMVSLVPTVSMADPGSEGGDEPEYLDPGYSTTTQTTTATVSCSNAAADNLSGLLTWVGCLLSNQILPILITLGVIGFIFGVIKFYLNPNNEKQKEQAKGFITKGLIALFVMVSFWGIIKIFTNSLGMNNGSAPDFPTLPTSY